MLWRSLIFLLTLALGAGTAVVFDFKCQLGSGVFLGASLALVLWYGLDTAQAGRLQRFLRANRADAAGPSWGLWGEIAVRVQKMLRQRDREAQSCQRKLDDFLAALQVSPNGVVLLDCDSRIEWCNQTAAQHFGLNPQRDIAQTIGNLVRDPGFVRYLASRDYSGALQMPGRAHSLNRPVMLSVQLHPYGEGRSLLLSQDITARQQAEAMRRDFIANVSHEIRTPLTVLAGFVETLQSLPLEPAEQQHYLGLMAQQSSRMQTLVNDLLTLSRLEGSPAPAMDCWTPLVQFTQQLGQDAESLSQLVLGDAAQPHELELIDEHQGYLAGNVSELLSAMGNLVSNAIRYTPAGGRIRATFVAGPDGGLEFSVTDTGPGIAPEHLGRLTERFYRVDRSRSRETGGTGLGLAIVKHVVQRHGANLSIESTPGKGSRFAISFPPDRVHSAQWVRASSP